MFFKKKYTYGRQYISFSDIWSVVKVFKSDFLTQGPQVDKFEKAICKYTGAKYCVAVANGTAALHLAVACLNLGEQDEVITSPITFVASANSALYSEAKVKFTDIDSETGCIDPSEIKNQISKNTKVIIPIHFAGLSCDMERIYKIAKQYNLFVIEDAAHSIGSEYKGEKVGNCGYSDMAIFSFHPVKTITTGEGGAITTNNKDFYEKLLLLRSHGITKNPAKMTKIDGPWYYEQHLLGFNYRLPDINAALGISQLKKLEKFVKKRREIVDFYKQAFANDDRFSFLLEREYTKAAYHLCPLLINFEKVKISKKELFEKLKEAGLNLQVHYIPVHLQPYYKNLGFKDGDFPKSEDFYKKELSLPLYYGLKKRDIKYIIDVLDYIIK